MKNDRKQLKVKQKKKNYKVIDDLVLPASRLKFTSDQLQNLNFILSGKLLEDNKTDNFLLARSVAERLIQRLICSVGTINEKFSSKYLVHLHDVNEQDNKLKYLIRLDKLSTPALYRDDDLPQYSILENDPECPAGYARIRMFSTFYKSWGEFCNPQGYLRRDKIQAKYVELLAQAASQDTINNCLDIDESLVGGSPGKIVDACTLYNILKIPTNQHVYIGPHGKSPRFPDPRDFRLAIVDEPNGIRLRIEFLSPALASINIDVRLLIGIESDAWPISTDFPSRVPLGHSDALLYQRAALTGFYMVGYGVQSSAWQIRSPSSELILIENYSESSTVKQILKLFAKLIEEIYQESYKHQKYQFSYKILNSYSFRTCLFYYLERDFNNPTTVLLNWSPRMLATHILKTLDTLILHLQTQKQPNYFFPNANLLANPGHLCEDDYIYESKQLLALLVKLYNQSSTSTAHNANFDKFIIGQNLETILLCKWKELIDNLLPPSSTRGRRFCFAGSRKQIAYSQYTSRQLEYLALLMKNALNVKKALVQSIDETWDAVRQTTNDNYNEDLVNILEMILDQAKIHYVRNNTKQSKKKQKIFLNYHLTVQKLMELVKKTNEEIFDDLDFVKVIFKWLYRVLDQNKRLLGPILRPYLTILFVSSHGNAWFLESLKKRLENDELYALGIFSKLINEHKLTPADGLVESVQKNWSWAKDLLKLIEYEDVRLIFVPEKNHFGRHLISTPTTTSKQITENNKDESKFMTLPKTNYFRSLVKGDDLIKENIPRHCILRDNSPLSKILQHIHRHGNHRCGGDLIETLIAMQKVNVLQDILTILPLDDRLQLLDSLQHLSSKQKKQTIMRRKKRSQTLPNLINPESYKRRDADANSKIEMALHKLDLNSQMKTFAN